MEPGEKYRFDDWRKYEDPEVLEKIKKEEPDVDIKMEDVEEDVADPTLSSTIMEDILDTNVPASEGPPAATVSNRGQLGRPSGPQPKRKRADEYSENPRTKASRDRAAKYHEYERNLTIKKDTDRKAVNRALQKLKSGADYKAADKPRQMVLEELCRKETKEKRIAQGKHAAVYAEEMGMNLDSSSFVINDPGDNHNWVDMPDVEDPAFEAFLKAVDQKQFVIPNLTEDEMKRMAAEHKKIDAARHQLNTFNWTQAIWLDAINLFKEKISHLNRCHHGKHLDVQDNLQDKHAEERRVEMERIQLCPHLDHHIYQYPVIDKTIQLKDDQQAQWRQDDASALPIPPHLVFTESDLAIWRNLMAHRGAMSRNVEGRNDGWVELPGPAHWWAQYADNDPFLDQWTPDEDAWNAAYAYRLVKKKWGYHVPADSARLLEGLAKLGLKDP